MSLMANGCVYNCSIMYACIDKSWNVLCYIFVSIIYYVLYVGNVTLQLEEELASDLFDDAEPYIDIE